MQGGATLGARAAFCFTAMCILGWSCAMCTTNWVAKKNAYYRLQGGLFQLELKTGYIGVIAGFLIDPVTAGGMSWINSLVEKKYTYEEFSEHMCALPQVPKITDNVCMVSQFLKFSSWGLVVAVVLSFVAMAAGASLLYRYVYVKPKAVLRTWMRIAYVAAAVLQFGGLAQYVWAASLVINMYPRTGGAHLGHSIVYGVSASLGTAAVLFVLVVLVGKSTEEDFNEAVSEQKKLMRDDPEMYGTTASAATGAQAEGGAYEGGAFNAENAFGAAAYAGDAYGGGAYGGGAYGAYGAASAYGGSGAYSSADQGAYGGAHGDFGIQQGGFQPGFAPVQQAGWANQTASV